MTQLVYSWRESKVREGLAYIWGSLDSHDARRRSAGVPANRDLIKSGQLLRAQTTDQCLSDYLPAYEEMGGKGLLIVIAAIMYGVAGGIPGTSAYRYRELLEVCLRTSSDDVRRLQAGPVGRFLPTLPPLEE